MRPLSWEISWQDTARHEQRMRKHRRKGMSEKKKIEVCQEYCVHEHITRQEIPSDDELYRLSELFKTFGDVTRKMCIRDRA